MMTRSDSRFVVPRALVLGAVLALMPMQVAGAQSAPCPSSSLPLLAPQSAAFIESLHSINSNSFTNICFSNQTSGTVDVWWVDFGPNGVLPGSLVFYNQLLAGQSYWQGTYVTHPWVIIDDATNAHLMGFLPIAADAQANITSTPEPATLALLGTGLLGIAGLRVRRRRLG